MAQAFPLVSVRAMDCLQRCYHLCERGMPITTGTMRERLQPLELTWRSLRHCSCVLLRLLWTRLCGRLYPKKEHWL